MTFDDLETSDESGAKVFTYSWQRGAKGYRYAAADQDVVLDFVRYTGLGGISHGTIEQSGDPGRAGIEVTVPFDHPVASLYRITPPVDSVVLTIHAHHVGAPADRRPVWKGRIVGVRWDLPDGRATIQHEPTYTSLRRTGLRRNYQALCPLVWGGKRCGLNPEAFALATTVQEVTGLVLSIPDAATQADGWWTGGKLVYEIESGVFERRFIRAHAGNLVTVTAFPTGLAPGTALKLYPGDDHTADTCAGKFGNIPNYGGFLYFPNKNPHGGSTIY